MGSADSCWIVRHPDKLRWRVWDDGTVVYDGMSGDTHLLDPLAGEVLRQLNAGAATAASLLAAMSGYFAEKDRDEALEILESTLQGLQAIDLILGGGRV